MMLSRIAERLERSPGVKSVLEAARRASDPIGVSGLVGSSSAMLVSLLARRLEAATLVVCPGEAEEFREDLAGIMGAGRVLLFPDWEVLPYDEFSPHEGIVGARLRALAALTRGLADVVVAPLRAFMRFAMPPRDLAAATLEVAPGDLIKMEDLIATLVSSGHNRVPVVEDVGTFAVRGGILDIFPQGAESPVRVEFFGDEIESIREFNPLSQRSVERVERVTVLPAREIVLSDAAVDRFLAGLKGKRIRGNKIEEAALHIRDRFFFDGMEVYAPRLYSGRASILSYLPRGSLVVTIEPDLLASRSAEVMEETENLYADRRGRANLLPTPGEVFQPVEERLAEHSGSRVNLSALKTSPDSMELDFRNPEVLGGSIKLLTSAIDEAARAGEQTFILCDNAGQAERLEEIVTEGEGEVAVGIGSLRHGFVYPEAGLRVLTDHEIFGRYVRRPRYPRYKGEGPLESYRALNPGDYVVHINHGIGRFGGVRELTVEGRRTECMLVRYQDGDKLFVPIEQVDLLQKYVGKDGEPPSLSKLGGAGWDRIKARTKRAIKEMAEELIRIYALRQARPGHAFRPDARWQKELEASFIYDETPDQLRTSDEIKRDMESPRPMDRLVCGDVGYGKTEVAIRAAFKAVMDGKQVAVLVPTTVLAQQHFYTFRERLADYPLVVEMLSRFRRPGDQRTILAGLARGAVDIVIGTHRLVQKDVEFKDLGLVIIDEEQRFGVAHKEIFKQMRATLDVLTLTATPIPRTLHMALMGARDMSVIDTPPKGRLPVDTEVIQFDEEVIAGAVRRELDRGGQVFFVHNRVQTIDSLAARVAGMLPRVRIAVAHGQMKERDLERVMLDFIDRRYDVLVSTMIVESGLDIPNVNTIIVDRADALGLAQLYQLRGRVGRSRHRAYAYLLVPKWRKLTEIQRKRLKTLTEFKDLGSGFKIAMRDLEIRGAGNILGPQQSGYIAEVGFDLYCRLLEEAVKELKGEEVEARLEAKIDTDLSAYLPGTYVEDDRQRVAFYRRLVETRDLGAVQELEAELVDRFGRLPVEARNLLEFQKIRILAGKSGMDRVVIKKSTMALEAEPGKRISMKRVEGIVRLGVDVLLESDRRPRIGIRNVPDTPEARLALATKVLNAFLMV
jgi:transcription-repair coupling factor (superfamily II helicase)